MMKALIDKKDNAGSSLKIYQGIDYQVYKNVDFKRMYFVCQNGKTLGELPMEEILEIFGKLPPRGM